MVEGRDNSRTNPGCDHPIDGLFEILPELGSVFLPCLHRSVSLDRYRLTSKRDMHVFQIVTSLCKFHLNILTLLL